MPKAQKAQAIRKALKCFFGMGEIPCLGHIVSRDGVRLDPAKTKVIAEWPRPTTVKELQAFLDFANWFRQYMQSYSQHTFPLTILFINIDAESQAWE